MKYVPNVLSVCRIFMSLSLPFLIHRPSPWWFIGAYLLTGFTDLIDGPIARHYKVTSKLGAKLDGLGDTMLFFCAFGSFLVPPLLKVEVVKCLTAIGVAFLAKLFAFIFTRVKFKEWNGMHTWLSKSVGSAIYLVAPIFVLMGEINFWVVLALSILVGVTALDEILVLVTSETYNPNHRGMLFEKRRKNTEEEAHA